jgi:cobalt-zinc-cadmium efflux system protein
MAVEWSAIVVRMTWGLLRQAVHNLMEGVPVAVDVRKMEEALRGIPGVLGAYDLHVWTITSGLDGMSGHVVVRDMAETLPVLRAARRLLKERFAIDHVTVQVEDERFRSEEPMMPV